MMYASRPLLGVLIAVVAVAVHLVDGKHWPDFSCHPYNTSKVQHIAVTYHKMGWNSCKESYDKQKGACDRVCIILNRKILYRQKKGEPLTFDVDAFIGILSEELGINKTSPADSQRELMNKVRSDLEICKTSYPEYATLPLKKAPCEPWHNFTECIDSSTGCRGK